MCVAPRLRKVCSTLVIRWYVCKKKPLSQQSKLFLYVCFYLIFLCVVLFGGLPGENKIKMVKKINVKIKCRCVFGHTHKNKQRSLPRQNISNLRGKGIV